jgi:hypothetical protein
MRCATAEGMTYSLIVINRGMRQVDIRIHVITVRDILDITINKVILFYTEISALEENVRFIFELPSHTLFYFVMVKEDTPSQCSCCTVRSSHIASS